MRTRRRGRDEAASDTLGTLLLVGLTVALGAVVLSVVFSTLEAPQTARGSFALGPAEAGAATASVVYRNGEAVEVSDLLVTFQRNDSVESLATSWATNDTMLRPGDRISFSLSPPLGAGEKLTVRVYQKSSNTRLTELASRAGLANATTTSPTMSVGFTNASVPNDGVTTSVLWARVSHPQGLLSVSRVVGDLSRLSPGLTVELGDGGTLGDSVGGDGNWSALVRVPTVTPAGSFLVFVNVTDAAGRVANSTSATLTVTDATGGGGGAGGGGAGGGGNVTSGTCYNCSIASGSFSWEGTRFIVPSSANVSGLRLSNFTWDKLHPERVDKDSAVFRITDMNHSFSVALDFGYVDDVPSVTHLTMWNGAGETNYVPKNATFIPLQGLDLNILAPTASNQWQRCAGTCGGSADGTAYYQVSGVKDPAALLVVFLRDLTITGQEPPPDQMGVFAFDIRVT